MRLDTLAGLRESEFLGGLGFGVRDIFPAALSSGIGARAEKCRFWVRGRKCVAAAPASIFLLAKRCAVGPRSLLVVLGRESPELVKRASRRP